MDNQTVLNLVMQIVITIVIPVVGGYAVTFLSKHMTAKQIETAQNVAKIGVTYAEQLGVPNSDKFTAAFNTAKSFAGKYGLKFTDEQWESMIEAAVKEGKKDWVQITKTPVVTNIAPNVTVASGVTADAVVQAIQAAAPDQQPAASDAQAQPAQ